MLVCPFSGKLASGNSCVELDRRALGFCSSRETVLEKFVHLSIAQLMDDTGTHGIIW